MMLYDNNDDEHKGNNADSEEICTALQTPCSPVYIILTI